MIDSCDNAYQLIATTGSTPRAMKSQKHSPLNHISAAALSLSLLLCLPAWSQAGKQAETAFENGQKLYKQGQYQQAIAAFQNAIKGSSTSSSTLPSMYYYIGSCFLQLKNSAQARQYFSFVRDHFPASREAALAKSIVGAATPQSASDGSS